MLACARSIHSYGPLDEPLVNILDLVDILWRVVKKEGEDAVEISIASVAKAGAHDTWERSEPKGKGWNIERSAFRPNSLT